MPVDRQIRVVLSRIRALFRRFPDFMVFAMLRILGNAWLTTRRLQRCAVSAYAITSDARVWHVPFGDREHCGHARFTLGCAEGVVRQERRPALVVTGRVLKACSLSRRTSGAATSAPCALPPCKLIGDGWLLQGLHFGRTVTFAQRVAHLTYRGGIRRHADRSRALI